MDVHDELFVGFGKHRLRSDLKSLLTSEIKLHTDTMYPFKPSRDLNKQMEKILLLVVQ
jgi:hypothetical protein